jgi:hypothetical protein
MHVPEDDAPGNLRSCTNSHTAAQLVVAVAVAVMLLGGTL